MHDDIKAYLDGELTPEQAAAVERLLATDADARDQADSFRAIGETVRAMARQHQPHGLERTLDRVAGRRRAPWWPVASGAAAVVVLGALVPLVLPRATIFGSESAPSVAGVATEGTVSSPAYPGAEGGAGIAGQSADKPSAAVGENYARRDAKAALEENPANDAKTSAPPSSIVRPGAGLDPNRRVIRNADLGVRVPDARRALAELQSHTEAMGGFVASSALTEQRGLPVAHATLRVPSARFEATVAAVRGMGSVLSESSSGEDVTAQVADLDARARTLAAEEQALIEMLRAARRLGDIMAVREKLTQVRGEIESLKAQSLVLKDLAAMSTVNVTLHQAEKAGEAARPEDWFEATLAAAVNALAAVGRVIVQGLVYALVLSPVWLPVVLVLRWAARRPPRP